MSRTSRRTVILSPLAPRSGKRAGRPRLWAFGYADFAHLFGMTEGALRMAVNEDRVDLSDLESVVGFANARRARRKAAPP